MTAEGMKRYTQGEDIDSEVEIYWDWKIEIDTKYLNR
jgi:hypothetical protein